MGVEVGYPFLCSSVPSVDHPIFYHLNPEVDVPRLKRSPHFFKEGCPKGGVVDIQGIYFYSCY